MADHSVRTEDFENWKYTVSARDTIHLSGTVYTARDAAHKRLFSMIDEGLELPFELSGAFIYYAGPTPGKNGMPVGSCGPTTSSRMDIYTPRLMDMGLAGTIGKGARSGAVIESIIRNKGIYLCAVGGAGALISSSIKSMEVIAFDDLGCESIKKFEVTDMPLFVGIDTEGRTIYPKI